MEQQAKPNPDSGLDTLLERYRTGDITPAEAAELEKLSGRQTVLQQAVKRAHRIRVRRRAAAVAAALAIGAVVTFGVRMAGSDPTATQPPMPGTTQIAAGPSHQTAEPTPAATPAAVQPKPVMAPRNAKPQQPAPQPTPQEAGNQPQAEPEQAYIEHPAAEPIVVCNTQCNADSVINEIWKFLKA
ncbi:MAG: hypothetical protein K5650_05155 [Bacteroidales bacterium]|nr:hypothetical protein [Bacteroidales bacterium]